MLEAQVLALLLKLLVRTSKSWPGLYDKFQSRSLVSYNKQVFHRYSQTKSKNTSNVPNKHFGLVVIVPLNPHTRGFHPQNV